MRRRGTFRDAQSSGRPEYPAHLGHVSACQGRSREAGGVSRPLIGRRHGLNNPNSGRPIAYKRGGIACDSTPRLPRGRRQESARAFPRAAEFQSAPPAREATRCQINYVPALEFQSAPPAREATIGFLLAAATLSVSIRASRAGGDKLLLCGELAVARFNPRLPRGRRRRSRCRWSRWTCFNPRLPRGRRPRGTGPFLGKPQVSIRASRAGGDVRTAASRVHL